MRSFEHDFRYLQAGVDALEGYILSKDTFWSLDIHPPKGEPDFPQMTLGGLLLARVRITAYTKSAQQIEQVNHLFAEMDLIRTKWKVTWEKKAAHSFSVRLRMWSDFIEEYRNMPEENADRYAYEVRLRAMLGLLQIEKSGAPAAEDELLTFLDNYVRAVFVIGDFIWEPEIMAGFPVDKYWYLYGKLPHYAPKSVYIRKGGKSSNNY